MILDTCALLWLAEGGKRLTPEAKRRIAAAPILSVSSITGFEIGMKWRAGKLVLPAMPEEWFREILRHHDIQVAQIGLEIAVAAAQLPFIHRDPCDRLIIATARHRNCPVVTADPHFAQYGIEIVW